MYVCVMQVFIYAECLCMCVYMCEQPYILTCQHGHPQQLSHMQFCSVGSEICVELCLL